MGIKSLDVYSSFKAAYHLDRIKALRKNEIIYPTQIQIDLTNECNHKCAYCFSKFTIGNTIDSINKKIVFKLLDDAKKLDIRSFHFTGGGEPFKHPNIYEILEKTISNDLEFGIVTNGTLIDFEKMEILKKMSWIRISVDASDKETYFKLRGIDEFDKIIQIIHIFSLQCPDTVLGLSFVINLLNYTQIVKFTELAKDLKVDNVRFSIAWFPQCQNTYAMNEINGLIEQAKTLQTKDFRIFDLTKGRLDKFSLEDKDYISCGYQHFTTVIGADSNIYPCCTLKYNSEANFGSLKEHSFEEIWTGEKRRDWLKNNHLKNVCSNNICWMEDKNKFIGYLITKNPKHVNFI